MTRHDTAEGPRTMRHGILGNKRVLDSLARVASSATLGHAYLFTGPEGTGKLSAAVAFGGASNCTCRDGLPRCDSCTALEALSHPEFLLLCDANKPRWLARESLKQHLGLDGPDAPARYAGTVVGLFERGYLEEPLPAVEKPAVLDGFNIVTDHLFGKGSAPSRECYTPAPVSEAIRRGFDKGDLSQEEFLLLKELYEYPLSVMPYRGSIHLAYITARKDWKSTRPVQSFLAVRSLAGGRKVVVIDDAHKMTAQAQNCLLKTLEEPPPDSLIILVTHDRRGLFPTIESRCQVVNFERLTRPEMEEAVRMLLGDDGPGGSVLAELAENCPGRLLQLMNADVDGKLKAIVDFFSGVGRGRLESALMLSSAVLAEGPTHRKKVQQAARHALELVIFWIIEIVRAKHGLPGRTGSSELAPTLKSHAELFDEAALLEAARRIDASLDTLAWNVDIGLALDTTLLGAARLLCGRKAVTL
jgi:hypothetical protein